MHLPTPTLSSLLSGPLPVPNLSAESHLAQKDIERTSRRSTLRGVADERRSLTAALPVPDTHADVRSRDRSDFAIAGLAPPEPIIRKTSPIFVAILTSHKVQNATL
jgi:hypothetical protein